MSKTKRAVMYARYSSDLQHERSIDDQFALCCKLAAGLDTHTLTGVTYRDKAKSGASMFERDGLLQMMKDAKAGKFDCIIVECLDRLSRDQEDLAGIFKRLKFYKVEILTCHEGVATSIAIGVRGLVGSMFLVDLADKVVRGQAGALKRGKIPGGVLYGYNAIVGRPGEREINKEQAAIVRGIFTDYANGVSPRTIARGLNDTGVPSPSGGVWSYRCLTTGGSSKGMLGNRLYIGELHWAKRNNVRNPDTGKVVKRANKTPTLIEVPHLRIIDNNVWAKCEQIRASRTVQLKSDGNKRRVIPRSESVLSGLLRCGDCGGDMRINNSESKHKKGNYSRRVVCAAAFNDRVCKHRKSYDLAKIERQTIKYVHGVFADPEMVKRFVNGYEREFEAVQRQARQETTKLDKRLNEIEASILRLVNALESGNMPEDIIGAKLQKLEAERVTVKEQRRLADLEVCKVAIHPSSIKRWYDDLDYLVSLLDDDSVPMHDTNNALHGLLCSVVVRPTANRAPYEIEPYARRAALGKGMKERERSPRQIAKENGVVLNFDNGTSAFPEVTISQFKETSISLGISQAA